MICTLCQRACGVDRANGEIGFCGMGEDAYVAKAMLHHWEEPCISGERGSGAVFFSGCSLPKLGDQPHAQGPAREREPPAGDLF